MGHYSVIPFRARTTERKALQEDARPSSSSARSSAAQTTPAVSDSPSRARTDEPARGKVYSLEFGYNERAAALEPKDFSVPTDDELPAGFSWEAIAKLADAIAAEDDELAEALSVVRRTPTAPESSQGAKGFANFLDYARRTPPPQIRLDRLPPIGGLAGHWSHLRLPALPLGRSGSGETQSTRRRAVLSVAPSTSNTPALSVKEGGAKARTSAAAPMLELLIGALSDTEN